MALTLQEQTVVERTQRNDLLRTNSLIRDQFAAGLSTEDIVAQFGPTENINPAEVLAAMSIAETHHMSPGDAFSSLPTILRNAFGKDFNINEVVKSFYTESEDFQLPFKPIKQEEIAAAIAAEEEAVPVFKESISRGFRPPQTLSIMPAGAFNQAYMINAGLMRQQSRMTWFKGDLDKEAFFDSMIAADTEEQKEEARKARRISLHEKEQDRISRLKEWEDSIEKLKTDPPGIFMSKVNAWRQGSGRTAQAALDVSSEAVDILSKVSDSSDLSKVSDGLAVWSRAYHKAIQSPDLMVVGVNQFDDMVNAFMQNAPYFGLAATAAIISPDKLTPFSVFFIGASMEGSEIKQTALDNGFSEESARFRGWVGGTINGIIEAQGGGVTKYNPKKLIGRIRDFPGKITNVVLREIFREEVPQEFVGMLLAGDTPRNDDGSVDWDDVVNRFLLLARDTAFTSAVLGTGSTITGEALAWDRNRLINKESSQAMKDAVDYIVAKEEGRRAADITTPLPVPVVEGKEAEIAQPPTEAKAEEVDRVTVETPPEAEDIDQLIENSPAFGLLEQPDGKFAVLDWDTQQEVMVDLSRERAEREATALNAGINELPTRRPRVNLPTSQDIETLSHTQLLRNLFKSVARHSRKIVANTTKAIIASHKNLAIYMRIALKGVDLTQGQRNSLMQKMATAKTEKDQQKLILTVEAIREISLHNKAVAAFNKIKRFINKASKRRLVDGGLHHTIHDTLQELLNNYTTLSPKILNSLSRTKAHLDRLRDSVSKNTSSEYAEALIPKATMAKIEELTRTNLKDLSADEINELNQSLKHYLKLNQLYSTLVMNKMIREQRDFLNNAVFDVKLPAKPKKGKRFTPQRGLWKTMLDAFVGIKNDDIYTIATKIWGRFDPISKLVMNGRRKQLSLTMKYADILRGFLQEHNITIDQLKKWSPAMHLIVGLQRAKLAIGQGVDLNVINIGGVDQEFTMAELIAFVLHSKNRYNLRQIVRNGISTRDISIGKISRDEFQQMIDIVDTDPAARAFVDSMEQFYIEMGSDINQVSRKLDGRDIATLDNYFHVEYERVGGVTGTEYVRDSLMDEDGRLRPRTSSRRPVMIRDVFEVINEDIGAISQFAGTAVAIRKLRSLANYAPFRHRIKVESNAEFILERLDEEIRSMQLTRQPPATTIERAVRKIEGGVAQSVLLNPKIWALQPFSAVLYATEVSDKYMLAIKPKLGAQFEKDINDNWTLYRARKEGMGAAKSIANPSTIRRLFTNTGNLRDKSMEGLHKGDRWGVSRAAQVTAAEMSDPKLSGRSLSWWTNYGVNPYTLDYGSNEFWQAFNDRADHLVTLTQPMFFAENKSSYSNSNNPLVRTLARFRSFIDQIGRIIRRQMAMARYGDVSRVEATRNIAIAISTVSIIAAVVRHLFGLVLGKEPDRDDFLREVVTSPLAVIPFAGYPAKKIADALLGGEGVAPEFSAMPIMLIDSILKHSWDIAKGLNYAFDDEFIQSGPNRGEKKSERFLKAGVKGIMSDYLMFQGVPTRTIEQIEWWKE